MSPYQLPADFVPAFIKSYTMSGSKFEIHLQPKGLQPHEIDGKSELLWLFAVMVNGHLVTSGPFHWDPAGKALTDENVANRLASFWGPSDDVKKAQTLAPLPEHKLEELLEKCRAFMFEYFMRVEGFDYDILRAWTDGDNWTIVFLPNAEGLEDRMIMFNKEKDEPKVQVSTFIEERSFHTVL